MKIDPNGSTPPSMAITAGSINLQQITIAINSRTCWATSMEIQQDDYKRRVNILNMTCEQKKYI